MKAPAPFPSDSPFVQPSVLSGLGSAGPGYNNYLPNEVTFAVEAFASFVAKGHDEREHLLSDGMEFAKWLESIPSGRGRQFYHTLCHVLFPDTFERIFSQGNKYQVARAHKIWTRALGESRPALDASLLELRKRLEMQHGNNVDYYELPVGTLIRQQDDDPKSSESSAADAGSTQVLPESEGGSDYDADTDTPPKLRTADNLILYGPPGTGKTYEMQARMKVAFDRGEDFSFVAFHGPVQALAMHGEKDAFALKPDITVWHAAPDEPHQFSFRSGPRKSKEAQ
jgi:5-methylcytosine-specific restriction protein B